MIRLSRDLIAGCSPRNPLHLLDRAMTPHEGRDEDLILDVELSQLWQFELAFDRHAIARQADPLHHERLASGQACKPRAIMVEPGGEADCRHNAKRCHRLCHAVLVIGRSTGLLGMIFSAAALLPAPASTALAQQAAAEPAVSLSITTSKSSYASGEAPIFTVAVTNNGAAACDLAATPIATLQVIGATLDRQPLTPDFVRMQVIDGVGQGVASRLKSAASGESITFDVDTGADRSLPVSTALRDGSALTARWPLEANGAYELRLNYQVPSMAGGKACAGMSNIAVVRFTVGDDNNKLVRYIGWAGLVLVIALILMVVIWTTRRSRRKGKPSGGVASATAIVILAAMTTFGAVVFDARPAYAGIVYGPSQQSGAIWQTFQSCMNKIQTLDPQLYTGLTDANSPRVVVYPWFESSHEKLKGGGPRDSLVRWDPIDTSPFANDPGGAALNPCASLYHELNHARDRANNSETIELCGDTGVPIDEVRATLAENRYRKADGLTERTTYDGKKLPKSLDDCVPSKRKDQKIAGLVPPVCHGLNGACGCTTGDPHLRSFDGYYYDLQAVGEFILTESTKTDLIVQTRQSAYPGSRTVAVNTAVAMRVNGTRLGFYLVDGVVVIRQDGKEVTIASGDTSLPGGARVSRQGDRYSDDAYIVSWADGSVAWLELIGPWGLQVSVQPAQTEQGALRGLLGNYNGNKDDDAVPGFEGLYRDFIPKWRVTDQNSLFDYGSGENTAKFTDLTFPDRQLLAANLTPAQQAAGKAACALLGITEPALLDACVLDVGATGQAAFATRISEVQVLIGPDVGDQTIQQIAVGKPGGKAEMAFDAKAGQRVYLQVTAPGLSNGCGVLSLVGADNFAFVRGCMANGKGEIDGTLIKSSGRYRLIIDPNGSEVASATVRLVITTDAEGEIAVDGPDATAEITAPGQVARLSFSALAGQKYFVDIGFSTLPDGCGTVAMTNAADFAVALACTGNGVGFIDTFTVKDAGRYAVRVDPSSDAVGAVRVRLTAVSDQEASTVLNGPPVTATIAEAGAVSRLTFNATAGQSVAIDYTESTLPAGCGISTLIDPKGSPLALACTNSSGTGTLDSTVLPSTGVYTILIDAPDRRTGAVKVRVYTSSRANSG